MIVHRLIQLYSASLRLYPHSYQAEFAEEMREVFSQAAIEAYLESPLALGKLCFSELAGLLASAAHAYLRAPGRQPATHVLPLQVHPLEGSWRELLLALAVFLLPAAIGLVNGTQQATASIGLPAAGLFLVVMIAIGLLGGFPLWSIPYVGIVLVVAGYLHLFQWVASLVSPALISNFSPGPWDRSTYLVLEVVSTGMLWLMLFCLTLLVVALLAVFNRFQPLLARLRHDWTLLSYILYGESVFALLFLFESHRSEPAYAIASLLCLITGVWFYLRSPGHRQRLLALLVCLTLAVGVAALEKGPLSPDQGWPSWALLAPSNAGRLLLSWIWMVAALLLPGLLSRLPSRPGYPPSACPSQAEQ